MVQETYRYKVPIRTLKLRHAMPCLLDAIQHILPHLTPQRQRPRRRSSTARTKQSHPSTSNKPTTRLSHNSTTARSPLVPALWTGPDAKIPAERLICRSLRSSPPRTRRDPTGPRGSVAYPLPQTPCLNPDSSHGC